MHLSSWFYFHRLLCTSQRKFNHCGQWTIPAKRLVFRRLFWLSHISRIRLCSCAVEQSDWSCTGCKCRGAGECSIFRFPAFCLGGNGSKVERSSCHREVFCVLLRQTIFHAKIYKVYKVQSLCPQTRQFAVVYFGPSKNVSVRRSWPQCPPALGYWVVHSWASHQQAAYWS